MSVAELISVTQFASGCVAWRVFQGSGGRGEGGGGGLREGVEGWRAGCLAGRSWQQRTLMGRNGETRDPARGHVTLRACASAAQCPDVHAERPAR